MILGSIPIGITTWRLRLMVRTQGFQPCNRGSIPLGVTNMGEYQSLENGADCKSAVLSHYDSSNLSSPTNLYGLLVEMVKTLPSQGKG